MSFAFPVPPNAYTDVYAEVENRKQIISFDEFVIDYLARRNYIDYRVIDAETRERYIQAILPTVRTNLDTELCRVICSDDLLEAHNLNPRNRNNYLPEDKIRHLVRQVVEHIYGTQNKILIRKKVTSCMKIIVFVLNTQPIPGPKK